MLSQTGRFEATLSDGSAHTFNVTAGSTARGIACEGDALVDFR